MAIGRIKLINMEIFSIAISKPPSYEIEGKRRKRGRKLALIVHLAVNYTFMYYDEHHIELVSFLFSSPIEQRKKKLLSISVAFLNGTVWLMNKLVH